MYCWNSLEKEIHCNLRVLSIFNKQGFFNIWYWNSPVISFSDTQHDMTVWELLTPQIMNQVNEYESIQAYAYARRSHLPWVTSGAWFICNQFTITVYKQILFLIQGCSKRETGSFSIHPPLIFSTFSFILCKLNSFCSLAAYPLPLFFKNKLHIHIYVIVIY